MWARGLAALAYTCLQVSRSSACSQWLAPCSGLAPLIYGGHAATVLRLAAQQDGRKAKKLRSTSNYFPPLGTRVGGGGLDAAAACLGE